MVSPVGKSSFKEQETASKPQEKVVKPVPSQSVPLKEVAAKAAAEALALELRATKAMQREHVAVLENGTSNITAVFGSLTTDKLTHLMLRSLL